MLFLLVALLIILLIVSYGANKKELVAPSFIFVLSFVFSSLWATAFYNEWELNTFHLNTFLVILGGCCVFFLTSIIVSRFFGAKKRCVSKTGIVYINVNLFIKILSIAFMVFSIFIILKSVLEEVGYPWTMAFEAIEKFDHISKFTDEGMRVNTSASIAIYISNALTYWYLYVFINNAICRKKLDLLSLVIVVLGMLRSMTMGSRNGLVNIVISGVAIYFLLLYRSKGFNYGLGSKAKIAIVMIPISVLVLFPKLTNLVGRNVATTNTNYLAMYCGAEIKNLDLYLQERGSIIDVNKNNMTFRNLNNWLGPKLGYADAYNFDLPFRSVNDLNLGNVYTTFYAYIYDYGYIGMIVLVAIMATIIQFVYEKCKRTIVLNRPNLWILIYGYMFSSIVLSFFSNKFYEQNFNNNFIYMIILWTFFNIILSNIRPILNGASDEKKD